MPAPNKEIGLAVLGLIFGIVVTNIQESGPFGPLDLCTGLTVLFISLAYRNDVGANNLEICAFSLIVGGACLFICGILIDWAIGLLRCPVVLSTEQMDQLLVENIKINGDGYLHWFGGCLNDKAEQENLFRGDLYLLAAWFVFSFIVGLVMKFFRGASVSAHATNVAAFLRGLWSSSPKTKASGS